MLDSTDSERIIMLSNNMSGREYTVLEAVEASIDEADGTAVEMLLKLVSLMLEELPPRQQLKILNTVSYAGWHIE
jgi:beta-lactamase class A